MYFVAYIRTNDNVLMADSSSSNKVLHKKIYREQMAYLLTRSNEQMAEEYVTCL